MRLGCDPECFLVDAAGAFVSAIGKIGGSKHAPRPIPSLGIGYAVQEDNVALEFNIPPANNEDAFVDHITKVKSFLEKEVNSMGLAFSRASAVSFPEIELLDPRSQEFGCDPDFNAWTMKRNPRPQAEDKNLRSCGGHVHVGTDDKSLNRALAVRYMDLFLGVPSVFMDSGILRKSLYGGPGAFRFKPYGFEYRTLSNYWIFDDALIRWVWRNTQRALDETDKQSIDIATWAGRIQQAISTDNKELAYSIVDHFGIATA